MSEIEGFSTLVGEIYDASLNPDDHNTNSMFLRLGEPNAWQRIGPNRPWLSLMTQYMRSLLIGVGCTATTVTPGPEFSGAV